MQIDRVHLSPEITAWRQEFIYRLATPTSIEPLFDRLPDVVFSIKDRAGRYIFISEACVERCGLESRGDAIGRTAHDLFPKHMADRYVRQDETLFRTGRPVVDNLDLTLFNDGEPGWCLTNKVPLYDREGVLIGLACLSKDLIEPSRAGYIDARFAAAIDHALNHYSEPLPIDELADLAGISAAQFDRRMKKVFQISACQFLIKIRIDAATERLAHSDDKIADIAIACGFCDQSALSRQFRQLTGLTPRQYRGLLERGKNGDPD